MKPRVNTTAVSVLNQDLLVTAQHISSKAEKSGPSHPGSCSFRSYSRRKARFQFLSEDQRKEYLFNNEDFYRASPQARIRGCQRVADKRYHNSSLREKILSVTSHRLVIP